MPWKRQCRRRAEGQKKETSCRPNATLVNSNVFRKFGSPKEQHIYIFFSSLNSSSLPPTLQLPQFFLCQNPASTLILELRLQLLYLHEETDGIGSDAWTGSSVFLELDCLVLQEGKGGGAT